MAGIILLDPISFSAPSLVGTSPSASSYFHSSSDHHNNYQWFNRKLQTMNSSISYKELGGAKREYTGTHVAHGKSNYNIR